MSPPSGTRTNLLWKTIQKTPDLEVMLGWDTRELGYLYPQLCPLDIQEFHPTPQIWLFAPSKVPICPQAFTIRRVETTMLQLQFSASGQARSKHKQEQLDPNTQELWNYLSLCLDGLSSQNSYSQQPLLTMDLLQRKSRLMGCTKAASLGMQTPGCKPSLQKGPGLGHLSPIVETSCSCLSFVFTQTVRSSAQTGKVSDLNQQVWILRGQSLVAVPQNNNITPGQWSSVTALLLTQTLLKKVLFAAGWPQLTVVRREPLECLTTNKC